MATSKNKKSDFQKLKDEWYKKLKTTKSKEYPDGFHDIEKDEDSLISWSDKFRIRLKGMSKEVWAAKVTYYQMAANFLQDYKFKNRIEKIIWEYHSNGISYVDIAETLNRTKVTKTNRDKIWKTVNELKVKMYTMYVTAEKDEYHE